MSPAIFLKVVVNVIFGTFPELLIFELCIFAVWKLKLHFNFHYFVIQIRYFEIHMLGEDDYHQAGTAQSPQIFQVTLSYN